MKLGLNAAKKLLLLKRKKQECLTAIVITLLLLVNSCNNIPVTPKEDQPGRRDYEWTVDTIRIFNNNIMDIWGSSADNLWGVGPGTFPVWHYNGEKWDSLGYAPGNIYSPYCVFGFSKNDVWIGGGNGRIYHYNGSEWSLNYQHTINGFIGLSFYDLYGTSSNDLYAVGTVWFDNETRRGIILHYDGSNWEQKYLADFNSYFYKFRVTRDKNYFIHCIKQDVLYNSRDTTVFYEFVGKELTEIYTDENINTKGGQIAIINGDIYFSLLNIIYKYKKNGFEELFKTNSKYASPTLFGRNEKDIFLGTSEGIEHYNGSDIQLLFATEGFPNDCLLFDKEVVLLNPMTQKGDLIYHGKIK